jgi:hypothetical protein
MLQDLSQKWMTILPPAVLPYGYQIVPVFGADASRVYNASFSQTISDPDTVLITGLAHGTTNKFTGWLGETLYSSPIPAQELAEANDKIVHLLSCSTAQTLAKAFKDAGCRAFIGYGDVVDIDNTEAWVTTFLICDAQIDISLANRKTVSEAIQDAKNLFFKNNLQAIGTLLQTDPSDGDKTLPAISSAIAPRTLSDRPISNRDLPPSNSIPSRDL